MLEELKNGQRLVGAKQVSRALKNGQVRCVFLAEDADPKVTQSLELLCTQMSVPVERVATMSRLGELCGIAVGSAVAALVS